MNAVNSYSSVFICLYLLYKLNLARTLGVNLWPRTIFKGFIVQSHDGHYTSEHFRRKQGIEVLGNKLLGGIVLLVLMLTMNEKNWIPRITSSEKRITFSWRQSL